MIHEVSIFDLVIFQDEVDQTPKIGTWADAISFGDSIRSNYLPVSLADSLGLSDRFFINANSTWVRSLSDTLEFSDVTHWRSHIESMNDVFFMVDWIEKVDDHLLEDELIFSDSMVGIAGAIAHDMLSLSDSLSYLTVSVLAMSDTLTLEDGLSMYFNNDPWRPMVPIVPEVP